MLLKTDKQFRKTAIFLCRGLFFSLIGLCLAGGPIFTQTARAEMQESIAAVVNQDAITISDVSDRMHMIIVSSGLNSTDEIRAKLAPQVIDSLIEERLQIQEAERQEIEVTEEEIQQGLDQIAQQNNMPPENFPAVITKAGINIQTIRNQVHSQIAWTKVVQQRIRPQVSVTEGDVDAFIERMRANIGKTEYLLAEIFLPVENPKLQGEAQQLSQNLIREIRAGAPFSKIAQQFSRGAGAQNGGDLGWIQQGHLPEELDAVLLTMKAGELSEPIRSIIGYHILLVRETSTITEDNMPQPDQIRSMIGLERLERQARRFMMELRAEAFIEKRVTI